MRKAIVLSAATGVILALLVGLFASFIYTRDFGANYKGRARLDYNWRYYFAACPKAEQKYEGKYFTFSYPELYKTDSIKENRLPTGTGNVVSAYLLNIWWHDKTEKEITQELSVYLHSPEGGALSSPSAGFLKWLTGEEKHDLVYTEKLPLKDGTVVLLLSGGGKEQGYLPGLRHRPLILGVTKAYTHLLWINPGGIVFNAEILSPMSGMEENYRERMTDSQYSDLVHSSAEKNAMRACVLDRFIETLEVNKMQGNS